MRFRGWDWILILTIVLLTEGRCDGTSDGADRRSKSFYENEATADRFLLDTGNLAASVGFLRYPGYDLDPGLNINSVEDTIDPQICAQKCRATISPKTCRGFVINAAPQQRKCYLKNSVQLYAEKVEARSTTTAFVLEDRALTMYTSHEGFTISAGNNLAGPPGFNLSTTTDPLICQSACNQTTHCRSVVVDKTAGKCWLKDVDGPLVSASPGAGAAMAAYVAVPQNSEVPVLPSPPPGPPPPSSSSSPGVGVPPSVPASPPPPGKKSNAVAIAAISVVVVFLVGLTSCLGLWYWRRKVKGKSTFKDPQLSTTLMGSSDGTTSSGPGTETVIIQVKGAHEYLYSELERATDNFSVSNQLGVGGFGAVYRGVLANGTPVAIKKLNANSSQGDKEFIAEATLLSQLEHGNLVRLHGWCGRGGNRVLVYELLMGGCLQKALHGPKAAERPLSWPQRWRIMLGVVRGLNYLHVEAPEHVVHRDIKPANVLLDQEGLPKLGDFGLARVGGDGTATMTIAGTPCYLPPEAHSGERVTFSWDIYGFGVLALEVGSGRKPWVSDGPALVLLSHGLYRQNKLLELADPALKGQFDMQQMQRLLTIGVLCTSIESKFRPQTDALLALMTVDTTGEISVPKGALYVDNLGYGEE